jgi:hypothetical protein
VDREERPDVDRVYMTFVQATTGSGGWPMSVWLTPALKPFYGGTYFPPSSKWGRPGFVEILQEIARVWSAERAKVLESADSITRRLMTVERAAAPAEVPGAAALASTVSQFHQVFDWRNSGFGDAPKFPRPSELLFLLREHARSDDTFARDMVLRTLRAMALGGMRDHVGGGFHRYAVDAAWRVPHFEKMLYDQAQLVLAYVEGAQVSGDPFFLDVAAETLRYVMRQMTDAEGGFYSAEDADSVPEHADEPSAPRPRCFYLWTADEIDRCSARRGDRQTAVRDPVGECAARSAAGIHRQESALRGHFGRGPRAGDRPNARTGGSRPGAGAAAHVRSPDSAAASLPRRQDPDGLERADDRGVCPDGADPAGIRTESRRVHGISPGGAARGGIRSPAFVAALECDAPAPVQRRARRN